MATSDLYQSLRSYWELEEESGARVDSVGSMDLTDNNTVLFTTGIQGNAADFELSASESLSHADNAALEPGDADFTFTLWSRAESYGASSSNAILAKYNSTGVNQRSYLLWYRHTADRFWFSLDNDGTGATDLADDIFGAPSVDTWYFHIIQYDASANVMGISTNNGTLDTAAQTGGAFDSSATFYIGASQTGGTNWDGEVDEVGYWDRLLTSHEKSWLYNGGSGRSLAEIQNFGVVGGSITNTGALTTVGTFARALAGAITNTGAVNKAIDLAHGFAGSITNTGSLTKQINQVVAGAITNTGSLVRKTLKVVAGSIANTGALTTVKAVLSKLYTWTAQFRASDREDAMHASSDETGRRA